MKTDSERKNVMLNKQYRGQVLRVLALFYPTKVSYRQIKLSLLEYGITSAADIKKHIEYLKDKEYLRVERASEITDEDMILMTAKGVDLVEGTIFDDGLYL